MSVSMAANVGPSVPRVLGMKRKPLKRTMDKQATCESNAIVYKYAREIVQDLFEGGGGSGNWGHGGRPGMRGGSLPTKAGSIMGALAGSERGSIRIPKISGKLFRAARKMRNIEVAASGSPTKILKRLVNIAIGRSIVRKLFR